MYVFVRLNVRINEQIKKKLFPTDFAKTQIDLHTGHKIASSLHA